MNLSQKPAFQKASKKLQKADLDNAINEIIENPKVGVNKVGDLSGILIHKFKMVNQLTLLAYEYEENIITLTLLAVGTHQNFYQDLKKLEF